MKKIAFKTFGCRANSLDTDALTAEAVRRGYQIVDEDEAADAYVINSCTVTNAADRETRVFAQRFKNKNPQASVAVVGCYAQVSKEELEAQPAVDFILGTANKLQLFDLMESPGQVDGNRDFVVPASGFLPEHFPGSRNARANIKIQDGCNFSCSYCIIPKARGRSHSLKKEVVLSQVQEARDQGFEEVVLTGIHLAHYGWDKGTNLLSLVQDILAMPDGPRLRLSTLDPFEIPEELIELVGTHPKLCPYFHIALQSGSDPILKSMRRIYRAEEFVKITNRLKAKHPSVFIGVDVIVGFPGETDEDFARTVECLEKSHWTKLHVFPFSLRRGTKAEELTGAVPVAMSQARSKQLREWSDSRYQAFLQSQVGTRQKVLLEKRSSKRPQFWQGHTANYVPTLLEEGPGQTFDSKEVYDCSLVAVDGAFVQCLLQN